MICERGLPRSAKCHNQKVSEFSDSLNIYWANDAWVTIVIQTMA